MTPFKDQVLVDLAGDRIGSHEEADDNPLMASVIQQITNKCGPACPARTVAGAHSDL
jgi:hypothetical protein